VPVFKKIPRRVSVLLSVRKYVVYVFSQNSKNAFLRFIETTCQKRRKRYQSFRMITSLTFLNTGQTNTTSEYFLECK